MFAAAVKQQREAQGWSQADLAEKVTPYGLTFVATTVYKIEANKRKVTVAEAIAIAHALHVSVHELVNQGTDSAFFTKEVLLDSGMQTLIEHESVIDSLHRIVERQKKMNKVIVDYRERHGEDPLWLAYLPGNQNLKDHWQPLIDWTGPSDYLASWKALIAEGGVDYLSNLGWSDDRTLPPSNG
jgi:transcriptional regulator with XRE-family HTH domain